MSDCWIVTHSGIKFDLLDPAPETVFLGDIVTALARLARFTGHSRGFYSVAQHCVDGLPYSDAHHALEWLLHDAHEAYTGDVNAPLKAHCPGYREIQHRVDAAIRERFGLPAIQSPFVSRVDLRMLATERRDLMPQCGDAPDDQWGSLRGVQPYVDQLIPRPEAVVRGEFRRAIKRWMPSDVAKRVGAEVVSR